MAVQNPYLYGSDRLGSISGPTVVGGSGSGWWHWYTVWGPSYNKNYELHDHLGNVRAIVGSHYWTGMGHTIPIENYYNYYAFGSYQPYRAADLIQDYKFGFNGQERKDDYRRTGNSYSYKFREYDDRIGRFTSVDPLDDKFPWNSLYAYCENRVIDGKDLEGKEMCRYDCDSYDPNVKLMAEWENSERVSNVSS